MLREAVAAHRAGRLADARAGYDGVLLHAPAHPWANYFRGVIAEGAQDAAAALACFRRAGALPQALVALGNLELTRGDAGRALAAFDDAIAARPLLVAAWTGRVLALKRLARLDEAVAAAGTALRLRRGWTHGAPPPGQLDPAEQERTRLTNRVKLRHDAAQLRFLVERHAIGVGHHAIADAYDALAGDLRHLPDDTTLARLDDAALARCGHAYNRLLHLGDGAAMPAGPLADVAAFATADRGFRARRPLPVVIDDVLAAPALDRLYGFLRDSTIWFEVKDHGAHLGAYFEDGLACPLVAQIAQALQHALPRTLGGLSLAQVWAYRHAQAGSGTTPHADIGAVSANFWPTPDAANADPSGGGLEIWPVRVPDGWDFRAMNADRARISAFLAQSGTAPVVIPYRCNRIVLFEANLFHRTQPGRFRPGFAQQRINITFLYDDPIRRRSRQTA
jgi:hypothetical protein